MRYHLALAILLLALGTTAAADNEGQVRRLRLDGPIGPMTADVVDRAVAEAEETGSACLVIEVDTPGGLDTAMRQIVKRILSADVPVVVYVSPGGSRAASAGAFIAIAAHVAAMAPGTNIGAAHPVQIGGAIADSTMSDKATNDAAAYIRALAKKRGRNPDWAEEAVRESASITAEEALAENVVDLVAPTLQALVDSLDGREVEVLSGQRRIETRGRAIIDIEMRLRERVLSRL
ncbi:MAG: ATP-dependent Clp protease proteolytic subunit, partial [Candidatus Latescibacteria bacterium]|nr:ATP-dependent Clp protease proteolytic subunit [Candidatus Latescibacterota bacterium]